MDTIQVKIAGRVGEIQAEYRLSQRMYKDFRTDELPEFRIVLTDEDIDFSATEHTPKARLLIKKPAILGKFSDALLDFDTILMHGAVVAFENAAYLFTALSGTGKTTNILKWLENLPNAFVVNGDKPFIRINDDGSVLACGSPWAGKENLYTNTMVPLKSIILMERAEENRIEQLSFAQAFPVLLQQTYRPDDEDKMRNTLRLMQRLNSIVSFWCFKCNNFKVDCFIVAYNALVRGQE